MAALPPHPAVMAILGERCWWLPSWLGWIPHVEIEGHSEDEEPVGA